MTASLIPREKSEPRVGLPQKTIIYGAPKVGKSVLASKVFQKSLHLVTDPTGYDHLAVYKTPVPDWATFLAVGKELVNGGTKGFDGLVIDTVDALVDQCRVYVRDEVLHVKHESDAEYGRGWDAMTSEFRLRVARLCGLGIPVIFVAHVQEGTLKQRNGLEISTFNPNIGSKGPRNWLRGFVDSIVYAHVELTKDGERRLLRLNPAEGVEAGTRMPEGSPALPDEVPMDPKALREAFSA